MPGSGVVQGEKSWKWIMANPRQVAPERNYQRKLRIFQSLVRQQVQRSFRVFLDHAAFKEHGMVLDAQPGLDEVVIVLTGRMARLPGRVSRKRGFQVGQV